MIRIPKRAGLVILVGIALVTVLLLAGSLHNLTFLPGHALPFRQMQPDLTNEDIGNPNMQRFVGLMRIFFILGWILLPFYVIYLIISPEARKRLLRDLAAMTPILLILYFLLRERPEGEMMREFEERALNEPLEEAVTAPVPVAEFNANPSEWLVTVTTIVLAVAATALIVGVIVMILRARRPKEEAITRVGFEAQAAIDALEAGGDLRDVIMRCYFEMTRAIGESRNLRRGVDMTAHEFETFLAAHGLPRDPVHNLTELFEKVRYGAFQPGRQDERTAINSLSAIVAACQRAAR